MDLERSFYKDYEKVSINTPNEQLENRWNGIEEAIKLYRTDRNLSELIKIYYKAPSEISIKESFVQCFIDTDRFFDETNEEEISLLAGYVIAYFLSAEKNTFLAFSIKMLDSYFGIQLRSVSELADEVIISETKEREETLETDKISCSYLKKEWEKGIVENETFAEEAPDNLVTVIKSMEQSIQILENAVCTLVDENKICQEKTQILSWIIGGWSNILMKPLSEVKDIQGALVLGVELANLVKVYPGPYAAEAFLHKMLNKCNQSEMANSDVSLTEYIDGQNLSVKERIVRDYGDTCKENNTPIIWALKESLTVDGEKEWIPAYKKATKINPDDIKFTLKKWSLLIYQECMINKN